MRRGWHAMVRGCLSGCTRRGVASWHSSTGRASETRSQNVKKEHSCSRLLLVKAQRGGEFVYRFGDVPGDHPRARLAGDLGGVQNEGTGHDFLGPA